MEVLVLEHLAELLDAPVGDQELQAGPRAEPPVAVVAEDRRDALPDVGDLVDRDPDADLLRQHRVGRESTADPQVEAGAELGVDGPDERHVVRLGRDVVARVWTTSSTTGDPAHRTMIKPASCTPPVTAGSAPASAGHQHSQPARPRGLLEPYAAMSGTYGSQGAPDEQSSGATRRKAGPPSPPTPTATPPSCSRRCCCGRSSPAACASWTSTPASTWCWAEVTE